VIIYFFRNFEILSKFLKIKNIIIKISKMQYFFKIFKKLPKLSINILLIELKVDFIR